jgi:malate synthase
LNLVNQHLEKELPMEAPNNVNGLEVIGPLTDPFLEILTPEALEFLSTLFESFEHDRQEILEHRVQVQTDIDSGFLLDFLSETQSIRNSDWQVAPIPEDLQDRRVEITGQVDRKMVINALNSGASAYMADFEDSHSPTWDGTIQGQINLRDAIGGGISFTSPEGKIYTLHDNVAVLLVRPRGWHLTEKHVLFRGKPVSASIFDFGLYFFHNANRLLAKGTGPYFYLPKLEHHLEARLWNDVFVKAQELLDIPQGTIKVTVLIETIPAAFQVDEILWELKDHIVALNCGRWDYIFSFIKRFKNVPGFIFPDRSDITMTRHCMRSYSLLVIKTCHRRGALAIGGMAAQIPIKDDPIENEAALAKVRADKVREANDGHDGTWVAHPALVSIAKEEFDRAMPTANQLHVLREDVNITAADLLELPEGQITEKGLRANISVGIQYMAHWLNGNGCVPLYHLMEDAATAEISRTQVWQWVHHPEGVLGDGRKITMSIFRSTLKEELDKIEQEVGPAQFEKTPYTMAARLFEEIITSSTLEEFLTLRAYTHLD